MADWNLVSPNIHDSSDNPIAAASVSVNGLALPVYNQAAAGVGAPGTPSGNSFYAPSGDTTYYQVSAPGFTTIQSTYEAGGSLTPDVPMVSSAPLTGSLAFQTTNASLNNAHVQLTGTDSISSTSVSGTCEQGKCTIPDLPLGTYNATVTAPGYETLDQQIDISGPVNWTPTLVSTDGGASGQPQVAPVSSRITSSVPVSLPPASDPYEGIYSNASFDGYYTSAQCRVYIGNMFLDELQSIQYAFQMNVVPVYNYAQPLVAAWGEGKGLVQGQLVLNFVSDLYLYTALTEFKNKMGLPADPTASDQDADQLMAALRARDAGASSSALDLSISTLLQNPTAVQRVKQRRRRARAFSQFSVNACVYPGTFNLMIEIGTGTQNKITRLLEDVKFISNEQILDQSGNLIGDAYGFMARRLK